MKLDHNPFPINVIDFENKKVLVRPDQRESTRGKNVIVAEESRPRMIKPKSPEVNVWKINDGGKKRRPLFKPTTKYLLNKYTSQLRRSGFKRARSPDSGSAGRYGCQGENFHLASQPNYACRYRDMPSSYFRSTVQWFPREDQRWQRRTSPVHSSHLDLRVSDAIVLHDPEGGVRQHAKQKWVTKNSVRIGEKANPAAISSDIVGSGTTMDDSANLMEDTGKEVRFAECQTEVMQAGRRREGSCSGEVSPSIVIGAVPCKIVQAGECATVVAESKTVCGQDQMPTAVKSKEARIEVLAKKDRMFPDDRRPVAHSTFAAGADLSFNNKRCGVVFETGIKHTVIDARAAHTLSGFTDWEKRVRADMIANQHIVGPGLLSSYVRNSENWRSMKPDLPQNSARQSTTQRQFPDGKAADFGDEHIGSVAPGTKPLEQWCPTGLNRTKKRRLQKFRTQEIREKQAEEERDRWFNQLRPMIASEKTWREKRLAKEENSNDESSDNDSEGGQNIEDHMDTDVNMVFILPEEFKAPEEGVAELVLGAERAVFDKPEEHGEHLKPLYIRGHVNGKPMGRMLVDGGAGVNVMPLSVFSKLGHQESELINTNMNLSGFSGKPSQAQGILSVELTVGSKTIPTAFFVVDVKGRYNVLLGRDWIHANCCVPSTLHQCLIQWVGDEVELIEADNSACVALTEVPMEWQHGDMRCLTGRDLSEFDFISVEKDGFVPIHVKPADIARLNDLAI